MQPARLKHSKFIGEQRSIREGRHPGEVGRKTRTYINGRASAGGFRNARFFGLEEGRVRKRQTERSRRNEGEIPEKAIDDDTARSVP